MATNDRGVIAGADNVDIANVEETVRDFAEQLLVQQKDNVSSTSGVHTRQLLPEEDLDSGADNGYTGSDREFIQSGLSGSSLNEVYTIDHDSNADNKVVVIFAVTNVSADPITTQIEVQNNTGGVIEKEMVEGQLTDPEDTLLLANPLVFGTGTDGSINQWVEEAGDDQVVYHGIVAEPVGNTLEGSTRFLSDKR